MHSQYKKHTKRSRATATPVETAEKRKSTESRHVYTNNLSESRAQHQKPSMSNEYRTKNYSCIHITSDSNTDRCGNLPNGLSEQLA